MPVNEPQPFSFQLSPTQVRARAELPAAKERFLSGGMTGRFFLIQPMPIIPEEQGAPPHHIWISVDTWENDLIVGKIAEAPPNVPGLQIGRIMMVSDRQVLSWKVIGPSGVEEGHPHAQADAPEEFQIPLPDFVISRRSPGYSRFGWYRRHRRCRHRPRIRALNDASVVHEGPGRVTAPGPLSFPCDAD